jgi:hypothetical protein
MKTPFYSDLIGKTFSSLPETVFKRCPTFVSAGSRFIIHKKVTFAASGFPNSGEWLQQYPASGCGNDTLWNLFLTARADEKIDVAVGFPGTTIADPLLQRDAYQIALFGALLAAKDCKHFDVMNTKFEGFGLENPKLPDPGAGARIRPWRETWSFIGCGKIVDVPMDFVPSEKGTQYIQPGGSSVR